MERAEHTPEETSNRTGKSVRGDDVEAARELVGQARAAEQREQTPKALGLYDDALAHFHPDSFQPFVADILRWKGTLLRERGETEAAYRCYSHSLAKASRSHHEA